MGRNSRRGSCCWVELLAPSWVERVMTASSMCPDTRGGSVSSWVWGRAEGYSQISGSGTQRRHMPKPKKRRARGDAPKKKHAASKGTKASAATKPAAKPAPKWVFLADLDKHPGRKSSGISIPPGRKSSGEKIIRTWIRIAAELPYHIRVGARGSGGRFQSVRGGSVIW